MVDDDIKLLREALAAGPTPGNWHVGCTFEATSDDPPETVVVGLEGRAAVAVTLDFGHNNPGMRDANAALIAAASPGRVQRLLDALESERTARREAQEALEREREARNRDKLLSEVLRLRADAARLDSGCIVTTDSDEFGEPGATVRTLRKGLNLRDAIDAAMGKEAGDD